MFSCWVTSHSSHLSSGLGGWTRWLPNVSLLLTLAVWSSGGTWDQPESSPFWEGPSLETTTSPAVRGEPALCDVDEVCFKSTGSSHQGNSPRRPQLQTSLSGRSAIPGLGRRPLKMVPGTFRGWRFPWQVSLLAGPTSRSARAGKRHLGSVCGCRFAHSEGRSEKNLLTQHVLIQA